MPMLRRSGGTTARRRRHDLAATRISPASGARKPAIIRSVVVLPQPEGPSRQTNSPCSMARSIASTDVDVAETLGEATKARDEALRRNVVGGRARVAEYVRIHDVDRRAGGVGDDLVEDVGELDLVLLARDVADVRRADGVLHRRAADGRVAHRLLSKTSTAAMPGRPAFSAATSAPGSISPRAAGVDEQRGRLHARQVVGA